MSDHPIIVAYGGGTNSTAMLCGFRERGIRPSLILFADTGGELPHTYEHLRVMSDKCQEWFGMAIETVVKTYKGEPTSLEGDCLRNKTLPALAFASKACSMKHKIQPVQKRSRQWMEENMVVKGRVEGLAFGQKWSEIVKADDNQLKLFDWLDKHDPHHVPCGCYDGGAA